MWFDNVTRRLRGLLLTNDSQIGRWTKGLFVFGWSYLALELGIVVDWCILYVEMENASTVIAAHRVAGIAGNLIIEAWGGKRVDKTNYENIPILWLVAWNIKYWSIWFGGINSSEKDKYQPRAKPSFAHCTFPTKFAISHLSSASDPSSTTRLFGVSRMDCAAEAG